MLSKEILSKLSSNSSASTNEAVRLLVKIADNILKDPTNLKIRTLQKENAFVSTKILPVKGAVECLKLMGFEEVESTFCLSRNASLPKLRLVKDSLLKWKSTVQNSPTETVTSKPVKRIVLPKLVFLHNNKFLQMIETHFSNALMFGMTDLQERAKNLIPLESLEYNAEVRLRLLQEQVKKDQIPDPELSIQDLLILELLNWFKNDFFTWVDSPECGTCGGKTHMSHMSTDPKDLLYTDRVEMHLCDKCKTFTPFPRYNDLNILLETREGRCGEWANVFTLLCCSLGWDARFVVDSTDHVWTEVFSYAQNRWVHCDPCENICDMPLMYETGWKKQISYIIAYSAEEIQDVTWRYTSNHKKVLQNRGKCSELELVNAIMRLRKRRQEALSESRKLYLSKRILNELIELMVEKDATEKEEIGRISGSSAWKLARGEIQVKEEPSSYIWCIKDADINNNQVTIRYSSVMDKYELVSGNKKLRDISKWNKGSFTVTNILRKVENDWKMVYLCREDGSKSGIICWKFVLESEMKIIDSVKIKFNTKTFSNGLVNVKIRSSDIVLSLPKDQNEITIKNFYGNHSFEIEAELLGGDGNVAWQHVQLFRQQLDNQEFGDFVVNIFFK